MLLMNLVRRAVTHGAKLRSYSLLSTTKEMPVSGNTDLNVLLSYKTVLKQLDPIIYPDNDRVIITCDREVSCTQIGSTMNISTPHASFDNNVTCEIHTPIRSNLNVTSMGDIVVYNFNGTALRLFSEQGSISIGKCQSEVVAARAHKGSIKLQDDVEAEKVTINTRDGDISTNKLKCLGMHLETTSGNISTEASFCEESYLVTKTGKLNLNNVHKHCKILSTENGTLNMVGFDGYLEVQMLRGQAEIQISRVEYNSYINIKEEGRLTLLVSDSVLDNTQIEISSKQCDVEESIRCIESDDNDQTIIPAKNEESYVKLDVNCPNSIVSVRLSSWIDMIEKGMETGQVQ